MRRPLRIVLDSRSDARSPGAHVYDRAGKGALIAATDAAPQDKAFDVFREHWRQTSLSPERKTGAPGPTCPRRCWMHWVTAA